MHMDSVGCQSSPVAVKARSRFLAARQVFEENSEHLGPFWDLSASYLLVLATNGTIIAANPAWQKQMGVSPAGLQKKNILSLIVEEDHQSLLQEIETLFCEKCTREFALRIKPEEVREARWISWSARFDHENYRFYLMGSDIQDNVSYRQLLAHREQENQVRFDALEDPVYICSANREIEYINRSMKEIIGEIPVNKPCYEAIYKRKTVCKWCQHKKVMTGERANYDTTEFVRGHSHSVSNVPVRNPDGSYSKLTTFRDITEMQDAIEEASFSRHIAEKHSTENRVLLASLSHELRTPLSAIIGLSGLFSTDKALSKNQREQAKIIESSGELLLSLVNDILDYSKIKAGKLDLELIPMSPFQTLQEIMGMFSLKAELKKISLTVAVSPDVPSLILGDPTRIRQILINLVSNALKFTEKGEVRIEAAFQDTTTTESSSPVLSFKVTDTGAGIPEDQIEKIFEHFSQADASISRTHGGTGLGLAITKNLVNLMGGEVSCRSKVGKGSVFEVSIPTSIVKNHYSETEISSKIIR